MRNFTVAVVCGLDYSPVLMLGQGVSNLPNGILLCELRVLWLVLTSLRSCLRTKPRNHLQYDCWVHVASVRDKEAGCGFASRRHGSSDNLLNVRLNNHVDAPAKAADVAPTYDRRCSRLFLGRWQRLWGACNE